MSEILHNTVQALLSVTGWLAVLGAALAACVAVAALARAAAPLIVGVLVRLGVIE